MWIRNKNTGLKWEVTDERGRELIASGDYEAVNEPKETPPQEPVKPKSKSNAKSD
jgi:hypothetical protein